MTIESFMEIPFWGASVIVAKNPSLRIMEGGISDFKNLHKLRISDSDIPPLKYLKMIIMFNPMIKALTLDRGLRSYTPRKKSIALMAVNLPLTEAALATKSLWWIGQCH